MDLVFLTKLEQNGKYPDLYYLYVTVSRALSHADVSDHEEVDVQAVGARPPYALQC